MDFLNSTYFFFLNYPCYDFFGKHYLYLQLYIFYGSLVNI